MWKYGEASSHTMPMEDNVPLPKKGLLPTDMKEEAAMQGKVNEKKRKGVITHQFLSYPMLSFTTHSILWPSTFIHFCLVSTT